MKNDRHNPSLIKLIDLGLYDRSGNMIRSTLEERAMRYPAVSTSMLADRVEELEEGNNGSTRKLPRQRESQGTWWSSKRS